ncbi:MAG TPA: TadE/TadG family type IV pilus assembly protein [Croceibacterium sp.]|nr:TadE/TadG family type IV pilus assembly protein [Croceibacterium sp.]
MIRLAARLPFARLLRDRRGTMAIETAIVAPMLIALSIGGFEVSSMVTRQSELQSAAAEAVAIVMAATPETQTHIDQIEAVVEGSSGIPEADVTFATKYRCGTATTLIVDAATCADEDTLSTFIVIEMTDRYTPVWAQFGIGERLDYNVQRTVQIS